MHHDKLFEEGKFVADGRLTVVCEVKNPEFKMLCKFNKKFFNSLI
jgi:hypothetical protein